MVRWLVAIVGLAIGACAGSSLENDDPTGEAGTPSGGSESGGASTSGGSSSGGVSPSGGTLQTGGAVAIGGSGGSGPSSGGEANTSSGGTGQAGEGASDTGGMGTGGSGASSGEAGAGGAAGCSEPNPAGCVQTGCPSTHRCDPSTSANCSSSQCYCRDGGWECTLDCGGGVCRPSSCPVGCVAGESACDTDGVTWLCMGTGDPSELIDAGCRDLFTQIPRYCCPATYKPECHE